MGARGRRYKAAGDAGYDRGMIETVFLDAGGVLVNPNWNRVADTLARHGVAVSAEALVAAEPHAKKELDTGTAVQATSDTSRGWLYFNLVLGHAGISLSA